MLRGRALNQDLERGSVKNVSALETRNGIFVYFEHQRQAASCDWQMFAVLLKQYTEVLF